MIGSEAVDIALTKIDECIFGLAQFNGRSNQRIEHRCKSNAERLMTLSTSAVAVCCCSRFAQFVEQPRVLDGDDGLGGEILDQLDLLFGEWPDLLAVDDMAPISSSSLSIGTRVSVAHHRNSTRPNARAFSDPVSVR